MNTAQKFVNYFKILILCSIAVLTTQLVNKKGDLDVAGTVVGLLMITVVCLAALLISEVKALKKIPSFAWASLLSLILTTPWCPLNELVLKYTGNVSTGQIGTVILVVAGVSIGTRLADVKSLSWKIVLVSIFVFCGTFFGSALIAQLILKMKGLI